MLKATVSGSFHRHMQAISRAVAELVELGVQVFSPADPRIVDQKGEFLFVASDRVRSIRLVQDRHLESIRASDFVWLVAPDGYVGQSASMELGFAVGNDIPIFSSSQPSDLTLRQYIRQVSDLRSALQIATSMVAVSVPRPEYFLIDPHASIEVAHQTLEKIDKALRHAPREIDEDSAGQIYSHRDILANLMIAPRRRTISMA